MPIPDGFVLGVATSAYQVEGAASTGGRGPSIWDTFTHVPGNTHDDVPGDRGSEAYARLDEDLGILADLGVDSYRFSISWSRLIPDGVGELNPEGVDYYNRLIDGLLALGISPNVTLYHWDLPQALEDRGGWANREVVEWFAAYARRAFELFGDRVPMWATLNEPIAIWVGYGLGFFAPGIADPKTGRQAMHHAMVAHGRAVQEFRASGATGSIGIVVDVWKRHSVAPTDENQVLADEGEDESFRFFFAELFAGGLSGRQVRLFGRSDTMPHIAPTDYEVAGTPIDFLGINVYGRVMVDSTNFNPYWWEQADTMPGGNFLSNGTELYPDALTEAVQTARSDYDVTVPIYITENGTPVDDGVVEDGVVHDDDRIKYMSAFLRRAIEAHDAGLGVEGYYAWTLLDNYEWTAAYSSRFGLVHVDTDGTFDRTYKMSAHWYRDVAHHRRLPVGDQ
ncbi:family 1 glycosylhydrolase [Aeromicrobium fastidiosum]|uniref:Family 1 glycosylhydrolase n=2 Tax=Aeromicrobium fastidiosum TaxID=52699 RepID=A0A641ASJ6_9ACTN|nr:family 1 glycosylhydrolase [Aeromicrobium fastidiosum]